MSPADAHLDHPGDITWFVGHGPAPVLGPCSHHDCRHSALRNVAWGPDLNRYVLNVCEDKYGCAGQCRAWMPDSPSRPSGARFEFMHFDVTREVHSTREDRKQIAPGGIA